MPGEPIRMSEYCQTQGQKDVKDLPERLSEKMAKDMSQIMSEREGEKRPEDMPERQSDRMSGKLPERMSKKKRHNGCQRRAEKSVRRCQKHC